VNRQVGHSVLIRRAQPLDAADLLALITEHIRYERADVTVEADLVHRLDAWMDQGRIEIFVAAAPQPFPDGRGLLGYAALTRDVATWTGREYGHLDCLFVREPARGHGVGRRLFNHVLERCREVGLSQIQWQTPAWNLRAVGFYERLGAIHHPKQRFTITIE
jgi:GNAT superfamily N-acetyltransferase